MSGELKFNRRYALVDEDTYSRLVTKKRVTPDDPLVSGGTMSEVKKTAQALRRNITDPFKDETQKAIAHTQLMRSYIRDLEALAGREPRQQQVHTAVDNAPRTNEPSPIRELDTHAPPPGEERETQPRLKAQPSVRRSRAPARALHSPSVTRRGRVYAVKNRRERSESAQRFHTPPQSEWHRLHARR